MEDEVKIIEYHLCIECRYHFSIPSRKDMDKLECACNKGRSEINRSGWLTDCPKWKEI